MCGVRPIPGAALPQAPFVIYSNHSSHMDFAVIWSSLPDSIRASVRPVAGRDYWERSGLRRWLARSVFNAVLIERNRITVATNPLEPLMSAIADGFSLIVFPEGTRSASGDLQPFKGGIFHIAQRRPSTPFVPVLLDNLNRILPKGEMLPVPMIATIAVGTPLFLAEREAKAAFLERARRALESLHAS